MPPTPKRPPLSRRTVFARRHQRRAQLRRRRLGAAVVLLVVGLTLALLVVRPAGSSENKRRSSAVVSGSFAFTVAGTRVATVRVGDVAVDGRIDPGRLRAELERTLPQRGTYRHGRARITVRLSATQAANMALAVGSHGGDVALTGTPVASDIAAPVIRQTLRNNCESAALSILLATAGVRADQLDIQRRIPRDGPLDPREGPDGRVWGDPDVGFVGRPDGGGTAGGFGVYPGPMARTAAGYGRRLSRLTGARPSQIYDWLRRGGAVMAWVGLSDGPYGEWTSPRGRSIRVNFGEHAVVLTGMDEQGMLSVVNPLEGTRERWSAARFETMWDRLGRRALGD